MGSIKGPGGGGSCFIDFEDLENREQNKGVKYTSYSQQLELRKETEGNKRKTMYMEVRNQMHWDNDMKAAEKRDHPPRVAASAGCMYWQKNIRYSPCSIKLEDAGGYSVTGGPPDGTADTGAKVVRIG